MTIFNIGSIYSGKNDFDAALNDLLHAFQMFKRLSSDQHSSISECLGNIEYVHRQRSIFDNAVLAYYDQRLDVQEQHSI